MAALSSRLRELTSALFRLPSPRGLLVLAVCALGAYYYAGKLEETYPLSEWLVWRLLRLFAYGALFSAASTSFGFLLLRKVFRAAERPLVETLVVSMALGTLAFVEAIYAAGFLGLLSRPFAFALPALMLAAGLPSLALHLRRAMRARRPERPPSLLTASAWTVGVLGVFLVYLGALTPDSINFDAAWCHLTVAQDYAGAGRIIPFRADYARNHPQLASLVHAWGWLLPNGNQQLRWMLALHQEFFFFVWTLAGVSALARWMLGDEKRRGLWASFFLFPAIFVYDHNLGGAADHVLAFFVPPLLLATARFAKSLSPRDGALFAALAGGALLTKYQAVYLIAAACVFLGLAWLLALLRVLRRRPVVPGSSARAGSVLLGAPALAAGVFVLVVAPHFARNFAFHGNPFYPFMQDAIPSSPTTPEAGYLVEYLFKDYNWRPKGTPFAKLKEALKLSFEFSFEPHYSFTKSWPVLGSLFTLLLPVALLVPRPGRILFGALFGWLGVMFWALTFRVDRNLQMLVPVFAAVTAATLARAWTLGPSAKAGLALLVGLQLAWGSDAPFYSASKRLKSAIDLASSGYSGQAKKRFDSFRKDYLAADAALPKSAKIVLHSTRRSLGLRREMLLDWPGQQGLILYERLGGPRAVFDHLASLGATHMLLEAGREASHSLKAEILVRNLLRLQNKPRRFGQLTVYELSNRPPPDEPVRVLAVKARGYRDGLYDLDDLAVYEGLPAHLKRYPRPRKALSRGLPEAEAMLAEADVVVLGPRADLPDEADRALGARFARASSARRWVSVYLPRRNPGAAEAPDEPEEDANDPEDDPAPSGLFLVPAPPQGAPRADSDDAAGEP